MQTAYKYLRPHFPAGGVRDERSTLREGLTAPLLGTLRRLPLLQSVFPTGLSKLFEGVDMLSKVLEQDI